MSSIHRRSYLNHRHFAMYKVFTGQDGKTLIWTYLKSDVKHLMSDDKWPLGRDVEILEAGIYLALQDIEGHGTGRHGIELIRKYEEPGAKALNRELQLEEDIRRECKMSSKKCPLFAARMHVFEFARDPVERANLERTVRLRRTLGVTPPSSQQELWNRAYDVLFPIDLHTEIEALRS